MNPGRAGLGPCSEPLLTPPTVTVVCSSVLSPPTSLQRAMSSVPSDPRVGVRVMRATIPRAPTLLQVSCPSSLPKLRLYTPQRVLCPFRCQGNQGTERLGLMWQEVAEQDLNLIPELRPSVSLPSCPTNHTAARAIRFVLVDFLICMELYSQGIRPRTQQLCTVGMAVRSRKFYHSRWERLAAKPTGRGVWGLGTWLEFCFITYWSSGLWQIPKN